jgi:hypothetical protein
MMRMLIVGLMLLASTFTLGAQGGTDIWVVSVSATGTSATFDTPRNLTRRPGYDNQPTFTPDGAAVLFTRIEGDGPSDIWRAPLSGAVATRFTRTDVESEYSATVMPDGRGISVIRVEADSTQRLWAFGWDGMPSRVILPALKPVGYHVWVGEAAIGAFVLGEPNALVLIDPRTERVDTLARGIGRAFARVPGREAFTFIHFHGDTAVVGEVDTRTRAVRRVAVAPPGGEYHVWTPSGQLLLSAGSRIYRWTGTQWDVAADFAAFGVSGITRMALSPDGTQLAFVATEPRRP